jgi:hypothetical protein
MFNVCRLQTFLLSLIVISFRTKQILYFAMDKLLLAYRQAGIWVSGKWYKGIGYNLLFLMPLYLIPLYLFVFIKCDNLSRF